MTVFEAYITNLGKYAEGQLVGETLKFPATTEEVQSLLKNIGVDGVRYEEFFITAFDGDVMGLYDYLTEYENLDELNHLAHLISELDSDEIETLEAALNKGDHTSSVADIINLVHNLDCYDLHPGVTDDETLGRMNEQKKEMESLIGTGDGWYDGEGVFHEFTQESVAAMMDSYKGTLESIKKGVLYSKDNGDGDTYSMIPPTEDVVSSYSVDVTKDNGKTVHIGDYSTVEELDKAISDAVKNGQLTQEEADAVHQ